MNKLSFVAKRLQYNTRKYILTNDSDKVGADRCVRPYSYCLGGHIGPPLRKN